MKRNYLLLLSLLGVSTLGWNAFSDAPKTGTARSSNYTFEGTAEPDADAATVGQATEEADEPDSLFTPDNKRLRADGPTRKFKRAPMPESVFETPTLSNDIPLTPPGSSLHPSKPGNDGNYQQVQFFFNRRPARSNSESWEFSQPIQSSQSQPTILRNEPIQNSSPKLEQKEVRKPEILPEEQFKKAIRATLAANAKRQLSTTNSTPGDVLLMALPYGADAMVYQPAVSMDPRDRRVPKGSYIYSIGTLCWNYPCFGKTLLRTDGQRVFARVGHGYQLRPSSFLALLAMSNIMPSYELKVDKDLYTIGHLVASEKAAVSKGANMSMTLVGLSFYTEPNETWKNEMGETWSIEKMVTEELKRSINQGTSEVTDWLLGLTAAVKLYEDEGKSLPGAISLAKQQVAIYQEFVLSVQNENGVWHPKFFLFKGTHPDVYETLYSSGHILRWLLLSLSDQQLSNPKVKTAVAGLMGMVNRVPTTTSLGSMSDRQLEAVAVSLHALSIYNQRVYGTDEPEEEKAKEVSVAPMPPKK